MSQSLLPGTPITEALSTSAEQLSTNLKCSSVLLQNPSSNSINILVGNASAQVIVLIPGASLVISTGGNLSSVYAKSASGTPSINYWPFL